MNIRFITLAAAAAFALSTSAAEPIKLNFEKGAHHPVISPDGTTVLYSTIDHFGLKAYNIATKEVITIDKAISAGFNPVFSADGSKVYYRTSMMVDGLRHRDIRSFDMKSLQSTQIAKPMRKMVNLREYGVANYAFGDFDCVSVTLNGTTKRISPLADADTYLWAALSPDSKHIAFSEPFKGVYLSDSNGKNVVKLLNQGDYVCWAGPNTVVAVVNKNDGYFETESRLVAVDVLTGTVEYLTPEGFLVGEATASASGMVVYSNLEGDMYMININDK